MNSDDYFSLRGAYKRCDPPLQTPLSSDAPFDLPPQASRIEYVRKLPSLCGISVYVSAERPRAGEFYSFEVTMTTLAFFSPGPWQFVIVLLVVLVLFGNRLPSVMRSLGEGITEFKKGIKGRDADTKGTIEDRSE